MSSKSDEEILDHDLDAGDQDVGVSLTAEEEERLLADDSEDIPKSSDLPEGEIKRMEIAEQMQASENKEEYEGEHTDADVKLFGNTGNGTEGQEQETRPSKPSEESNAELHDTKDVKPEVETPVAEEVTDDAQKAIVRSLLANDGSLMGDYVVPGNRPSRGFPSQLRPPFRGRPGGPPFMERFPRGGPREFRGRPPFPGDLPPPPFPYDIDLDDFIHGGPRPMRRGGPPGRGLSPPPFLDDFIDHRRMERGGFGSRGGRGEPRGGRRDMGPPPRGPVAPLDLPKPPPPAAEPAAEVPPEVKEAQDKALQALAIMKVTEGLRGSPGRGEDRGRGRRGGPRVGDRDRGRGGRRDEGRFGSSMIRSLLATEALPPPGAHLDDFGRGRPGPGRFRDRSPPRRIPIERARIPIERAGIPIERPMIPIERPMIPIERPGIPIERPSIPIIRYEDEVAAKSGVSIPVPPPAMPPATRRYEPEIKGYYSVTINPPAAPLPPAQPLAPPIHRYGRQMSPPPVTSLGLPVHRYERETRSPPTLVAPPSQQQLLHYERDRRAADFVQHQHHTSSVSRPVGGTSKANPNLITLCGGDDEEKRAPPSQLDEQRLGKRSAPSRDYLPPKRRYGSTPLGRTRRIRIENFPSSIQKSLKTLCQHHGGPIETFETIKTHNGGKLVALVQFVSQKSAENFQEQYNRKMIDGSQMTVTFMPVVAQND